MGLPTLEFPSVAVVIPTKNRPGDLNATLRSLLNGTVLPNQLIIIDQSSNDDSEKVVEWSFVEAPKEIRAIVELSYVHNASLSGLTAARNTSLALVKSDILLFLDDDVILEKEFIQEITLAHRRYPDAVGVGGIITNYSPPTRLLRWWESLFVRGPFHDDRQPIYRRAETLAKSSPLPVTRLGGGLMSFRMGAIGGRRFDENLTGPCVGEDVDFCARLAPKALLLIIPSARLVHKRSSAARSEGSHLSRHALAMWYLYHKNWSHGIKNRISFLLLNLGYCIAAVVIAVRRSSLEPFEDLVAAVKEARRLIIHGSDTRRC